MILDLAEKLQATQQEIERAERELSKSPMSFSLKITLDSLYRRYETLEERFCLAASADFQDVCSYRMIYEPGSARRISYIANILSDFQNLFSLVYDSVKSGQPKMSQKIRVEAVEESSFEFGYSFSGSLGFVFTMPNERLLHGESQLDETMSIVLDMIKVSDAEGFHDYVSRLGPGPIRALYRWTQHHVLSDYSADIKWRRDQEIRAERLVQMRTFSMETEESGIISGRFSEEFEPEPASFVLGEVYTAHMLKKTKLIYSTDEEKPEYFLISLSSRFA